MLKQKYKPKHSIGTKVLDLESRRIGIIKDIDNFCSKVYDEFYDNPGYLEYYIKWGSAWTRHYCHELDAGIIDGIIIYTNAAKILYSPKTKKAP